MKDSHAVSSYHRIRPKKIPNREIRNTLYTRNIIYAGTKFPIYKVLWLREASQIRQTVIPPMCIKHSSRIPIDPAIFAAIGHRFIAKKKKKINADARV